MKTYTVAVLGATGAVGRQMLKILQQCNFPVGRLIPLSSARSAGTLLPFCGEEIPTQEAGIDSFQGVDLVLGAAANPVAQQFAPAILETGAVFVDNSSAFRLTPGVPLVVPEINPEDLAHHQGIVANPNCTTIITLTAIAPLRALGGIKSIRASTYQAVSGAGAGGPRELLGQTEQLLRGEAAHSQVFAHPIAFNLIPKIGAMQEQGYTAEEMKLQFEGRKILHLPQLNVSCTCVRVPVVRSHSICATVTFDAPVDMEAAAQLLSSAPGCRLMDNPEAEEYPMPLNTSDQDLVYVGRLRPDLTDPNSLCLWCCGDQLRKGAATNAVQIAQLLTAQ